MIMGYKEKVIDLLNSQELSKEQKEKLEDIFPELAETEDERIRKELIENLRELSKMYDTLQTEREYSKVQSWIAWLKKQGKQKQDPCNNCKDVMLNCHNFPCVKKRAFKQGKSVLEVINEEKVDNANFHLWTIQDAKDGDVLYSPTHHLIWIYKDNEHYYACVNMNYVTKNVATDGLINIPNDACIATKEQRDTLMKAMADAGYTFDFDKKELKKIEKKSSWSEEDENLLKLSFENLTELKDRFGEEYGKVGDCISWLNSLKQRYTWKPSDEQIKVLDEVIKNPHLSSTEYNTLTEIVEQLEKLKEE